MNALRHLAEQPAPSEQAKKSPLDWIWPMPPAVLQVYDKYSGQTYRVQSGEPVWTFSYSGHPSSIQFAEGADGSLQRRLALLTSAKGSPAVLHSAARQLVRTWAGTLALLATPVEALNSAWEVHASTADLAALNKRVLKLACIAEVGHWNARHLSLVKSLDTRVNASMVRRALEIESRQRVASSKLQANIVSALDAVAQRDALSLEHLEGACALALIFQHGVRPVQLLCLDVSHARFFTDASDELACVISFHAAKQTDGKEFEILRQVKPEWVALVARLHAAALGVGRPRIFASSSISTLWRRAESLCNAQGFELECSAKDLRHTGAQTLADAGHSRASIQHFLGHASEVTATAYVRASLQQAELINTALGASKLYKTIVGIASKTFVSLEEIALAVEDQQIGGVVGESLVAGIGLCRSGQSSCVYNPVTSCYGCQKFMPSLDRASHVEAVEGMRQQVRVYLNRGTREENPAYRQLTRALAGAQEALESLERLQEAAK